MNSQAMMAAETPKSPYNRSNDDLNKQLESLSMNLSRLSDTLTPILRPTGALQGSTENKLAPPRPISSPLVNDLIGSTERLTAANKTIEDILSRLEV